MCVMYYVCIMIAWTAANLSLCRPWVPSPQACKDQDGSIRCVDDVEKKNRYGRMAKGPVCVDDAATCPDDDDAAPGSAAALSIASL